MSDKSTEELARDVMEMRERVDELEAELRELIEKWRRHKYQPVYQRAADDLEEVLDE